LHNTTRKQRLSHPRSLKDLALRNGEIMDAKAFADHI
jgi:hypothetical protein